MSATTRRRVARKLHRCDSCARPAIEPGHVYLVHTIFGGDLHYGPPYHSKECADCAIRYGREMALDPVPEDQPYRYWLGDTTPHDPDPLDGAA